MFMQQIAKAIALHNRHRNHKQIVNRSIIEVLSPTWSSNSRLHLRSHYGGRWVGKQFKVDPTAPLRLFIYRYPVMDIFLDTGVFTIISCTSTYQANALGDARLLHVYYHYTTPYDAGGMVMQCMNGIYFTKEGTRFRDTPSGLVCLSPHARVRRTVISTESIRYVRHVRQVFHDVFYRYAALIQGTDVNTGPYNTESMGPVFDIPKEGRMQTCVRWFKEGGHAFDDRVLRCFLSMAVWSQYHWQRAAQQSMPYVFTKALRTVSNAIRNEKYYINL